MPSRAASLDAAQPCLCEAAPPPPAAAQGKIRVFARIRPMLPFEAAKGQAPAVTSADELTIAHPWKGALREYNFDTVFPPGTPQEQAGRRPPPLPSPPCTSPTRTAALLPGSHGCCIRASIIQRL